MHVQMPQNADRLRKTEKNGRIELPACISYIPTALSHLPVLPAGDGGPSAAKPKTRARATGPGAGPDLLLVLVSQKRSMLSISVLFFVRAPSACRLAVVGLYPKL